MGQDSCSHPTGSSAYKFESSQLSPPDPRPPPPTLASGAARSPLMYSPNHTRAGCLDQNQVKPLVAMNGSRPCSLGNVISFSHSHSTRSSSRAVTHSVPPPLARFSILGGKGYTPCLTQSGPGPVRRPVLHPFDV